MDGACGKGDHRATLPRMTADGATIDLPVLQVQALAAALTAQAEEADAAAARLAAGRGLGDLQPAIEDFLECHRTAARAFAGELRWLGSTLSAVVDSWLELDARLLPGRVHAR